MLSSTRTRSLGRALGAAVVLSLLLVGVGVPAEGGSAQRATLEVVKVVDGAAPAGSFEIEVDCDTDGTIPLTFDGPGMQTVPLVGDSQDCRVTEIEDLGALSVTYDCQDLVEPADPDDRGCQPPGPGGNFFQSHDVGQVVRITVTNTFAGGPTSTSTTTSTTSASASPTTVTSTTAAAPLASVAPTAAQPATATRANPRVVG